MSKGYFVSPEKVGALRRMLDKDGTALPLRADGESRGLQVVPVQCGAATTTPGYFTGVTQLWNADTKTWNNTSTTAAVWVFAGTTALTVGQRGLAYISGYGEPSTGAGKRPIAVMLQVSLPMVFRTVDWACDEGLLHPIRQIENPTGVNVVGLVSLDGLPASGVTISGSVQGPDGKLHTGTLGTTGADGKYSVLAWPYYVEDPGEHRRFFIRVSAPSGYIPAVGEFEIPPVDSPYTQNFGKFT